MEYLGMAISINPAFLELACYFFNNATVNKHWT